MTEDVAQGEAPAGDLLDDTRPGYPGQWAYTWLDRWPGMETVHPLPGGPDVLDGAGRVDRRLWAAAVAARPALPPVAPSAWHQHDANCWTDDILPDRLWGPGRVCEEQARFEVGFDDAGTAIRWDANAWYPVAVVARYWDGTA